MSTTELSASEQTAMENAQLLVVTDTSKRGVEIGFLSARALYGERIKVLTNALVAARTDVLGVNAYPTRGEVAIRAIQRIDRVLRDAS
jgi:hypothetical protein